jgi:toxin ParE1/3/4
LAGIYLYHLSHSRFRAETPTGIVQRPRHFIAYRFDADRLEILRILHDTMDLPEHLA